VQFGRPPRSTLLEPRIPHVFAAANHSVSFGKSLQLWTQLECALESRRKSLSLATLYEELFCIGYMSVCRESSNLPLHNGRFDSPNAGRFSGAKDSFDRGLLVVVNGHKSVPHLAAE
jgi:hypothetical protein